MSIILMRHAESQHNVAKQQVKSKHSHRPVKDTPQYINLRTNPLLQDQLITNQGSIQAERVGEQIDWENVGMVLVSPMRRCLQTCRKMLSKTQKKIQVKVQPILKGRLSNIWGYGSSVLDLKLSYCQYNFDNLNETSEIPWYIKTLVPQKQTIYSLLKNQRSALLENLKQQYDQFKERVKGIKQLVDQNLSLLKGGEKLLIISHSCVLRTIAAETFNHKNKGISAVKFEKTKPLEFQRSEIFKWLSETPQGQNLTAQQQSKQQVTKTGTQQLETFA